MLQPQQTRSRMTPTEFDTWVQLPENADRLFELIGGFVSEKNTTEDGVMVAHFDSSEIAQIIGSYLRQYLLDNPLGRLSGADGGYEVGAHRLIPDIGFIRHDRFPKSYTGGYLPTAPDLAVEVISATDREANILVKLSTSLAAGTIVWIVYPTTFEVQVHTPYEPPLVLSLEETLTGGSLLPNFSVPVRAIFQPLLNQPE